MIFSIIILLTIVIALLLVVVHWMMHLSEQLTANNLNSQDIYSEISKIYKLGSAYFCHAVIK